jgi:hypothetical protein
MESIVFKSKDYAQQRTVAKAQVFTKLRWRDQWLSAKGLYVNSLAWGLAPSFGTASFAWRYGVGMLREDHSFNVYLPDAGHSRYVKVVIECGENGEDSLFWYGIIQTSADQAGGTTRTNAGGVVTTGEQTLSAIGLERLLFDSNVKHAHWLDAEDNNLYMVDRPIQFNEKITEASLRGNRSALCPEGTYVFEGHPEGNIHWTTVDIVEYLLKYFSPRDAAGQVRIPIALDQRSRVALMHLKHRPHVAVEQQTNVRDILNQILPPQRLLSWFLEVEQDRILLRVVRLTNRNMLFPEDRGMLLGAERTISINYETAKDAQAVVVTEHSEVVDRVRMRGARATSTWSAKHTADDNSPIDAGWSDPQKTKYDQGYSTAAGYAALTTDEKKMRNAEVRQRDELSTVYSRFAIPLDWDNRVNGTLVLPDFTGFANFKPYRRELFVSGQLALRDGYKYEVGQLPDGTIKKTEIASGPHNPLPPLVLLKIPESDPARYVQAELVGLKAPYGGDGSTKASYLGSAHVMIPDRDRSIVLRITGDHQHMIAGTGDGGFVPLDVESATNQKLWDWRDAWFTISAELDFYAEGKYPPDDMLHQFDDQPKEMIVYAPQLRLDYIAPNTIVGVNADGTLDRLTHTVALFAADDRAKLQARAEIAFAWYGEPRTKISLTTAQVSSAIQLGDYVSHVFQGGERLPVNCTITGISMSFPTGDSIPLISYETSFFNLDLGMLQ